MKIKNSMIIFIGTLLLISIIPSATAVVNQNNDLLGGLGEQALTTINNLLAYKIDLPGYGKFGVKGAVGIPLWAFLAVFFLIYTVIYFSLDKVQILKEQYGARIIFSIALSLIIEMGTNFLPEFWKIVSVGINIIIIFGFVFIAWLFWWGIKKTQVGFVGLNADAATLITRKKRRNIGNNKKIWKTEIEERLMRAQRKALKEVEAGIRSINTTELEERISKIKMLVNKLKIFMEKEPEKVPRYIEILEKNLGDTLQDIKINFSRSTVMTNKLKDIYKSFKDDLTKFISVFENKKDDLSKNEQRRLRKVIQESDMLDKEYSQLLGLDENLIGNTYQKIDTLVTEILNNLKSSNLDEASENLTSLEVAVKELNEIKRTSILIKKLEDQTKKIDQELEKLEKAEKKP